MENMSYSATLLQLCDSLEGLGNKKYPIIGEWSAMPSWTDNCGRRKIDWGTMDTLRVRIPSIKRLRKVALSTYEYGSAQKIGEHNSRMDEATLRSQDCNVLWTHSWYLDSCPGTQISPTVSVRISYIYIRHRALVARSGVFQCSEGLPVPWCPGALVP